MYISKIPYFLWRRTIKMQPFYLVLAAVKYFSFEDVFVCDHTMKTNVSSFLLINSILPHLFLSFSLAIYGMFFFWWNLIKFQDCECYFQLNDFLCAYNIRCIT